MNILNQIFSNELFIKFTVAIIGIVIINFTVGIFKKYVSNRIPDSEQRYHLSKLITLVGYFIVIIFLLIVFYQILFYQLLMDELNDTLINKKKYI